MQSIHAIPLALGPVLQPQVAGLCSQYPPHPSPILPVRPIPCLCYVRVSVRSQSRIGWATPLE